MPILFSVAQTGGSEIDFLKVPPFSSIQFPFFFVLIKPARPVPIYGADYAKLFSLSVPFQNSLNHTRQTLDFTGNPGAQALVNLQFTFFWI